MKVDTISTRFGDIDVEFSTFTKGFFIKKYPEKLECIKGLMLLKNRENSFKEYTKLEEYVRELVHNALIDFEFQRRVIIYQIRTSEYDDSLEFLYLVCDESVKNQSAYGKQNVLSEYHVIDSNMEKYIGKRNILGQILFSSSDNYVFIDYDENLHNFFKAFTSKFHELKKSLVSFFDEEKVVENILSSQNPLKMLVG